MEADDGDWAPVDGGGLEANRARGAGRGAPDVAKLCKIIGGDTASSLGLREVVGSGIGFTTEEETETSFNRWPNECWCCCTEEGR